MQIIEMMVTFGLVILIWIIQLLHYPTFRFIDPSVFSAFSRFHSSRISIIVIPLMLMELALCLWSRNPVTITLVGLIWVSTFTLQVPCHNKFQDGHNEVIIERLISTNWIRTILWSIKLIYLGVIFKWPSF